MSVSVYLPNEHTATSVTVRPNCFMQYIKALAEILVLPFLEEVSWLCKTVADLSLDLTVLLYLFRVRCIHSSLFHFGEYFVRSIDFC